MAPFKPVTTMTEMFRPSIAPVMPTTTQPTWYLASGDGTNSVKRMSPYVASNVKVSFISYTLFYIGV